MLFKKIRLSTVFIAATLALSGCGGSDTPAETETVAPTTPAEPTEVTQIIISSGLTTHRGITAYNLDGTFEQQIIDLRGFEGTPNGLAPGPTKGSFLTSTDGSDAILNVPFADSFTFFYGSSLLNGGIYDIEYNPVLKYYYVIESNGIEVFDVTGYRLGLLRIPNILGACTLSSPRNMHITDDGILYVADYSGHRILKYDVTNPAATCLDSYSIPATLPYAVIKHSNGLLYFSSFQQDAVFTYDEDTDVITNIFDPGTLILQDPRALVEMPNGDVLVSASVNSTIERIDATGVRQGVIPFIQDLYSVYISDIELLTH